MNYIELTYFHTMNVKRRTKKENSIFDDEELEEVKELQNIKCGYSQNKRGINTDKNGTLNITMIDEKIFCNADLDIRKGDNIEIFFKGRKIGDFVAGEPYIYDSHLEISVEKIGGGE